MVPLADGNLLFRGDGLSIRIEGRSAAFFRRSVLPLLEAGSSLSDIVPAASDVDLADLQAHLNSLVECKVLRVADGPVRPAFDCAGHNAPYLAALAYLGFDGVAAGRALETARIAIFGLEAHGAHLAKVLADCGVGQLLLVDPYPCQPENLALMGSADEDAVGKPRQEVVASTLAGRGKATRIETAGDGDLTREAVETLAEGCHLLVGCYDRGFLSAHLWLNQVSLAKRIPAIYADLQTQSVLLGPLVVPGETACYMCYRMRSVACTKDFDTAMNYEEHLDRQKDPALHRRGVLPGTPQYAAGLLASEIIKHLLSVSPRKLAGKVLEFDVLDMSSEIHPVLEQPYCPACKKKLSEPFHQPMN